MSDISEEAKSKRRESEKARDAENEEERSKQAGITEAEKSDPEEHLESR